MEKFYFFSKLDSKWRKCGSEKTCLRMAEAGYPVKKVVYPVSPPKLLPAPDKGV